LDRIYSSSKGVRYRLFFPFPDCNRKIKIRSFRVSFTLFILRHINISQFKGKILAVNKRNIRDNESSLTSSGQYVFH